MCSFRLKRPIFIKLLLVVGLLGVNADNFVVFFIFANILQHLASFPNSYSVDLNQDLFL
jgi:hypothetical protein